MKANFTLLTLLFLLVISSCCKEDEPGQTTSTIVNQERSASVDIMTLVKNDCSNCHAGGSRLINITTSEELDFIVRNGSFARQLFEKVSETPCGNINSKDLDFLRSWYNHQKR